MSTRDVITIEMLDMPQFETAYKKAVLELEEAKKIYDDEMKIELIFNESGQFRGHVWKATSFYTDEQLENEGGEEELVEDGAPVATRESYYRLTPEALLEVQSTLQIWENEVSQSTHNRRERIYLCNR